MTPSTHSARSFNRPLLKTTLVLGCLFSGHALALAATGFPYAPGISVTGLTGDITTGYADAMVPVIGQSTQFFYLDPQGLFHNSDDYSAALGLGARTLSEKSGILGAYVFGDYNHAPDGHGFWFVSPGIERLGNRVDFSANLYIPVGSDQVNTGTAFGNQLGIYDYITFAGHTEYDQLLNTFESVGFGGDAEVGYRLPVKNNTKIYLGGYHFEPKNVDNITGGTVRLEVPFTERLNVTVSDGYDNAAHNTFKAGLTYNFVGRHTPLNFRGDLSERMVDPIHRNLMAVAGSAHTAQPIVNSTVPTGQTTVVMDHISFFLPGGNGANSGNGTYENPYIGLNQGNVDNANTQGNNNFFFNGGLGAYTSNTPINMFGNNFYDNVYGRQSYQGRLFVQPAQGNNRPVLNFPNGDGLTWTVNSGDANIVVDSVTLAGGNNNTSTGILLTNNGAGIVNTLVNNVDIVNTAFHYAMFVLNGDGGAINLAIDHSTVNGNGFEGVHVANASSGVFNFAVNNSTFNGNGADGINAINSGTFNFTVDNSTFNGNALSGIDALNLSNSFNLTVNNSTFDGNLADGIFAFVPFFSSGGTFDITVNNSIFSNNSQSGIYAQNQVGNTFNLTANNSAFNDNALFGIETHSLTSVTYPGSTFSGNTPTNGNPPMLPVAPE